VNPFHPILSPRGAAERTHSSAGVPCILFALSRECRPFLRSLRPQTRLCRTPFAATLAGRTGASVLVVESGPGAKRTAHALDWLLELPRLGILSPGVSCVISAGFAGALQEAYAVGDIILATEIVDVKGDYWSASWPPDLPLVDEPHLRRGRLLTTPNVIGTTEEKRRLGQLRDAVAVDMESAIVAAWCAERAIPFGAVRTISDPIEMELSSELVSLFGDKMSAAARLIGALANKPTLFMKLWRLARNTRVASRQLAVALGALLAAQASEIT
jgi:adenosylhomocysteine nucleosidase